MIDFAQIDMPATLDIWFVGTHLERGYQVSITKSIARILTTSLGERVMRPTFGSSLYLLRDRDFTSYWRVAATRYIYESITRWEPRVRFIRLHCDINAKTGSHKLYLELDSNE